MSQPPSPPPLSPALRERLFRQVKTAPAETRSRYVRRTAIALLLGLVVSFALFALLGGVRIGERAPAYVLALLGSVLVLEGAFGALALRRRTAAAAPTRNFVVAALSLPIGWALVTGVTLLLWPDGGGSDHAPRHDLMCGALSVSMGLPPLFASIYARRASVFVAPAWVGAALGATWMTFGTALMTFACACATSMHMVLGHVLPAAIAGAVLGTVLGQRYLSFRAQTNARPTP